MAQNGYHQPPFQAAPYSPSYGQESNVYNSQSYSEKAVQPTYPRTPSPYSSPDPVVIANKYEPNVSVSALERATPDASHRARQNSYLHLASADRDPLPPSPNSSTFQYHLDRDGIKLESTACQYFLTWILALLTLGWVIFTIYFAYNCSIDNPLSESLIFSKPERTILLLNVLSQFTIFLLGELTTSAFEAVRWALASTPNGISAFTFVGLSRATSVLGIVSLLFHNRISGPGAPILEKDGHRLWGLQRYVLFSLV
jgi:hypothetical protein